MDRFTILAVKTSLCWLIFGFVLGGLMIVDHLIAGDWRAWFQPTHGHVLFVGWFVQFVMGFAFWLLPRKRLPPKPLGYNERLAFIALGCLNLGLMLRVVAEPVFRSGEDHAWVDACMVGSGALQVAAIIMFVSQMWPRIYGKNKLGIPAGKS